ncbi:leucine-rich repeat domain-containing protein [Nostoc sp. 'Peltigera membranacea cyanobiont' 232]|uniref:leucine-rich repeat domain-containing protein n=1 Tax=Nostoc sp. 'Peltigera membranacea cyanobiont' 232 TaxID=2014531 RepID=UPI000B956EAA|nr:COR domain-containing protein [Nostoc sp. 'Peltigera membranacea cyanobiont' 232]OYE03995.1 GTPase [Nostoc sp. 'Peltigera membranacea cyanobiont' 232]
MTNEELLQILEEAARDKATILDLSDKGLIKLPAEIGQLSNLSQLYLQSNQLTMLPVEIGQLSNLTVLDLSSNQLKIVPQQIGQLSNLRELYLSSNQLKTLPQQIGQLSNLRELYLNSNQLKTLPQQIGQLSNLRELYLNSNQLETLPQQIGQLSNLNVLNLGLNRLLKTLPAEIGQLSNLTELDLNSNPRIMLPVEISQFCNLRKLDLNSNQLTTLPTEIGQLSNLRELYLNSNQLTMLPAEIGQLSNLRELYLQFNQLITLPAEIGQLSNLSQLNLQFNQLITLPAELDQLSNLRELYLNSNQLITLPTGIGQLSNLRELYLNSNQLITLPKGIGQLTNLYQLDLNSNQLTMLPAEIGQLTNLYQLYLNSNQLTTLPAEIGQLTNLCKLNLSNNQLTMLPAEIGQLTNLYQLYLNLNQLTTLPAEIGQLTNLYKLNLSNNQLTTLPAEIGQLTNLSVFELSSNTLETLPPEIRTKRVAEILNFYRQQLEQETDRLYEAKLLIVGEGGAGKTTLAKKIQDQKYTLQHDEISTQGIDVIQWKFLLDNHKEFQVNIWDFGGQEIYHATHQFFLTKRSLYAVVADTRKEDTDFYYWLNVVKLLSDDSPLLIIKNEKHERKREINEKDLRKEFINFKETLSTNFATNRGIPEILDKVQHFISSLPHVGIELPKTWVKVREALEHNLHECISLEEYFNICQQHGFTKQEDKLQLSGYLHDLGVCLHFQDDDLLRKTVILKPTWGTDAVYKVLDNPQIIEKSGKFDRNDLKNIWLEDKYADMRPELLQLMIKFKLCYEIPSRPGTYIAPQLLSTNQPDFNWDESNNLILRYTYDFMPKGILTRFIVEMHSLIEQQILVWKTGVVLSEDQTRAEVIENYNQREIKVRVAGNRKKDLLIRIIHELDKIHKSYERLKYKTLVPCNCEKCKDSQTPHFYERYILYNSLDARNDQIQCQKTFRMVDVRRLIDDVLPTSPNLEIPMSEPVTRNLVFISYSHKDKKWFDDLKIHLEPLIREQNLKLWDDTQIKPGAIWRNEIQVALAAAKVAVLLVSPDFLASSFISQNELPPLLEAAKAEGVKILWIPLRASNYKVTAIERYQATHVPDRPLNTIGAGKRDKAWVDICEKINAAAASL